MRGPEIHRETSLVRSLADSPLWTTDLHLSISKSSEEDLTEIRFHAPLGRFSHIREPARQQERELAERLPPALIQGLTCETGIVRTALRNLGKIEWSNRCCYRAAVWRGMVLGIENLRGPSSIDVPWRGTLESGGIDLHLPVILGPSATLAVVSYGLEALGIQDGPESFVAPPALTIVDTARSPYPPQRLPQGVRGDNQEDQVLIVGGRWRGGGSHGTADPVFFLLTRPEFALRPLAVSAHFSRRNLAIRAAGFCSFPALALVIDSCRPRVGPRRGETPFDAEISLASTTGGWLAGGSPLRLQFDPWLLLARIRGGLSRPRPAVDRNPIEGDSYGWAPFVLLDLTASQLLGGATT